MSLHYLIDGYNAIYKIPWLTKLALADARDALVHFIERERLQGSLKNKVTVIFDGQTGLFQDKKRSFVRVIFSENESADDCIKEILDRASHCSTMAVVTEDREIQIYARRLGAKVLTIRDFFGHSEQKGVSTKKKIKRTEIEGTARISKSLEHQINTELKKFWLKK